MLNLVTRHDTPIFRNNYNNIIGVCFKEGAYARFEFCSNNKQWLAFNFNGDEVGVLTDEGIRYAERLVNVNDIKYKKYKR